MRRGMEDPDCKPADQRFCFPCYILAAIAAVLPLLTD
jgi:hypothetical protein